MYWATPKILIAGTIHDLVCEVGWNHIPLVTGDKLWRGSLILLRAFLKLGQVSDISHSTSGIETATDLAPNV